MRRKSSLYFSGGDYRLLEQGANHFVNLPELRGLDLTLDISFTNVIAWKSVGVIAQLIHNGAT